MTTVAQGINLAQTPALFQGKLAEFRASIARTPFGATVQNTTPKAAEIVTTWRAARQWVEADPMVSNAVIGTATALLDETALQALADLRTHFGTALAEYKRKLEDPAPDLPAPDAMRIWRRVERQLSAGIELGDILEDTTDAATLAVIQDEIRSWRRASMPGDLRSANFIADADVEAVNARRFALATPAQRAKLEQARAAAKGEYNTNLSLGAAEHHVKHLNAADPGNTILPMWGEGELRV